MKHIILIAALRLCIGPPPRRQPSHDQTPARCVAGSTSASMTMPMKVALPLSVRRIRNSDTARWRCTCAFRSVHETNASSDVM